MDRAEGLEQVRVERWQRRCVVLDGGYTFVHRDFVCRASERDG